MANLWSDLENAVRRTEEELVFWQHYESRARRTKWWFEPEYNVEVWAAVNGEMVQLVRLRQQFVRRFDGIAVNRHEIGFAMGCGLPNKPGPESYGLAYVYVAMLRRHHAAEPVSIFEPVCNPTHDSMDFVIPAYTLEVTAELEREMRRQW